MKSALKASGKFVTGAAKATKNKAIAVKESVTGEPFTTDFINELRQEIQARGGAQPGQCNEEGLAIFKSDKGMRDFLYTLGTKNDLQAVVKRVFNLQRDLDTKAVRLCNQAKTTAQNIYGTEVRDAIAETILYLFSQLNLEENLKSCFANEVVKNRLATLLYSPSGRCEEVELRDGMKFLIDAVDRTLQAASTEKDEAGKTISVRDAFIQDIKAIFLRTPKNKLFPPINGREWFNKEKLQARIKKEGSVYAVLPKEIQKSIEGYAYVLVRRFWELGQAHVENIHAQLDNKLPHKQDPFDPKSKNGKDDLAFYLLHADAVREAKLYLAGKDKKECEKAVATLEKVVKAALVYQLPLPLEFTEHYMQTVKAAGGDKERERLAEAYLAYAHTAESYKIINNSPCPQFLQESIEEEVERMVVKGKNIPGSQKSFLEILHDCSNFVDVHGIGKYKNNPDKNNDEIGRTETYIREELLKAKLDPKYQSLLTAIMEFRPVASVDKQFYLFALATRDDCQRFVSVLQGELKELDTGLLDWDIPAIRTLIEELAYKNTATYLTMGNMWGPDRYKTKDETGKEIAPKFIPGVLALAESFITSPHAAQAYSNFFANEQKRAASADKGKGKGKTKSIEASRSSASPSPSGSSSSPSLSRSAALLLSEAGGKARAGAEESDKSSELNSSGIPGDNDVVLDSSDCSRSESLTNVSAPSPRETILSSSKSSNSALQRLRVQNAQKAASRAPDRQ